MWRKTEITVPNLKCPECGHIMEAQWEEVESYSKVRSTVFHCYHCEADKELTRNLDHRGEVVASVLVDFFFG